MRELKIHRKDRGAPISVPVEVTMLQINEPVSDFANLGEVLHGLPNLEDLTFYVTDYGKTDLTRSLDFLQGVKQLKNLSLRSMSHLEDCSALASCESLEWIGLSRHMSNAFDFGVLPLLPSLKLLSVEMPTKQSLSGIAKAVRLESLELLGGLKLDNLEPLASLVNLHCLKLWSGSLKSTRGLTAFQKLEKLNLGHSKVHDTTDLGGVKMLKEMELIGNKAIDNLEFLREGNLEYLGLYEIPILKSLIPIGRLRHLKKLSSAAKIIDGDLSPLTGHPALEKVTIPGRYKSELKKYRTESGCVFKVGKETLKLTKTGPVILETASEAKERLLKKLEAS